MYLDISKILKPIAHRLFSRFFFRFKKVIDKFSPIILWLLYRGSVLRLTASLLLWLIFTSILFAPDSIILPYKLLFSNFQKFLSDIVGAEALLFVHISTWAFRTLSCLKLIALWTFTTANTILSWERGKRSFSLPKTCSSIFSPYIFSSQSTFLWPLLRSHWAFRQLFPVDGGLEGKKSAFYAGA